LTVPGLISIARTQRGSVRPVSTVGLCHASCATAGTVNGVDLTMRSGGPKRSANPHTSSFGNFFGGGMSFGSPSGAPASTHRAIVSICWSESDRSFSKCWIPTVRSMCHGGICLATTRALMARAHGRVSAKVISDIGAM
jgi:hypothetical protein